MIDKYLTVTALTKYIKRKLDMDKHLRTVWLKGEISNFKHHNRGHMYMTIKDKQTRIQAIMFAGNNRFLKFMPENGMQVLIKGEVSVFEAAGQYQLYIKAMEPDGIGALYVQFEQLKKKLQEKGYFSDHYKKPIPSFPKHIGVITSPTGAAVRDIITTIKRRYPIAEITIIPVLVQGPTAAQTVVNGIKLANEKEIFDVLIVGRGGGSIEELWCFNEEIVVDAIYHSKLPIISAVGHETDTTLSDFVADLRAPTPTGAAELAVPSYQQLMEKITALRNMIQGTIQQKLNHHQKMLKRLEESYAFRYPEQLIRQKEQELDKEVDRLRRQTQNIYRQKQEMLHFLNRRLNTQFPKKKLDHALLEFSRIMNRKSESMKSYIEQKSNQLALNIEKLVLLNPLKTLERGFSITYTPQQEILKTSEQIEENEQITVRITDATLHCKVLNKEEIE